MFGYMFDLMKLLSNTGKRSIVEKSKSRSKVEHQKVERVLFRTKVAKAQWSPRRSKKPIVDSMSGMFSIFRVDGKSNIFSTIWPIKQSPVKQSLLLLYWVALS